MQKLHSILAALILAVSVAFVGCTAKTDAEYIAEAEQSYQRGEIEAAIIRLQNALQIKSDNAKARFLLGKMVLATGDAVRAEKELRLSLRYGWPEEHAWRELGVALLLRGKHRALLDELANEKRRAFADAPLFVAYKAQAHLALQEVDKAEALLSEARKNGDGLAAVWEASARLYQVEGKLERAADAAKRAVALAKTSHRLYLLQGWIYEQQKNSDAAKDAYRYVVERLPTAPMWQTEARIGLARLLLAEENLPQAEQQLKPVLQAAPNHTIANYLMGSVAFHRKQYVQAEDRMNVVLAARPDYAPALMLKGASSYANGQFEQAAEYLERFVVARPGHVPARKLLASTLLRLHQPSAAFRILSMALDTKPNDPDLMALMGLARADLGDVDAGREYLEKAVSASPDTSWARTELAKLYLLDGAYDHAVKALEEKAAFGSDLNRDSLLVLTHLKQQNYQEASSLAREMLTVYPTDPEPRNLLGLVYMRQQQTDQAKQAFEDALALSPRFVPSMLNLASLEYHSGESRRGQELAEKVLELDAANRKALSLLARSYLLEGKTDALRERAKRAESVDPKSAFPNVLAGRAFLAEGNLARAVEASARALRKAPNDPDALVLAGEVRMAQGYHRDALGYFRRYAALEPGAKAKVLMAQAEVELGKLQSAIEVLDDALDREPDYVPALRLLAKLKANSGDSAAALALSNRIKSLSPDEGVAYEIEGDIHFAGQRFEEALSAYADASRIRATSAVTLKAYETYYRLGQPAAAQELLHKWLRHRPDDVTARLALAESYRKNDSIEKAKQEYQHVLKLDPENIVALNDLAWLYQTTHPEQALAYAERAATVRPDEPAVLDTYGWILVQLGRVTEGLGVLSRIAPEARHIPEIEYHLAVALAKAGDRQQAREKLRDLLASGADFEGRQQARELIENL